jgi:hypothetical protein
VSDFQTNWVDWGGTIDIRPRTVFTPTSASDIAKVITTANQQNRRVRVCGSGWSFSDVAVSDGSNPWSVSNTGGQGQQPVLSVEFAVNSQQGGDVQFIDAILAAFDAIVAQNNPWRYANHRR